MPINFFEPLQFTTFMGPEGRHWSERSAPWGYLFRDCTRAVLSMRKHRLDEGRALLRTVEADLEQVESPLLRRVLDRFYEGAIGYYAYLAGDYDWAHRAMDAGCRAVADAVEQEPFLMPFAHHCKELITHRARIDRNRGNWQGMLSFIELGRAMNDSSAPLCTLADGTEVTYRTLAETFDRIDGLSSEEQDAIADFLDQDQRQSSFEAFTRSFMDPPGFVIRAA